MSDRDKQVEMRQDGKELPPGEEPPPPHVSLSSVPVMQGLGIGGLLVVGLLIYLIYQGREMPFIEMRYQHTDSTGYRPLADEESGSNGYGLPARAGFALGSVPRSIGDKPMETPLPPMPDLPDGSTPPMAKNLVNPLANDPGAVNVGEKVFAINCVMCHGRTGKGDGAVGESYTPQPDNLKSPKVVAKTDGEIFYAITNGILSTPIPEAKKYIPREWHAFRRVTTDRERWEAISFVRALQAGKVTSELGNEIAR